MQRIAIIGPNTSGCTPALYAFGEELGKQLCNVPCIILSGGMGGFMEAVCKGAKSRQNAFEGQTIGILPGETPAEANPFIDVPICTGMGIARNAILVQSAEIIIAAGGGAGTLSELAFAWQKKKKVLCVTTFGGWTGELAGEQLDQRSNHHFVPVETIDDILQFLARA